MPQECFLSKQQGAVGGGWLTRLLKSAPTVAVFILLMGIMGVADASLYPAMQYSVPVPVEHMTPQGEFVVSVFEGDKWSEAGRLTYDKYFRERSLDIGPYIKGNGPVLVRITQQGGGAAHVDFVSLGGLSPHIELNSLLSRKLSANDFDVLDASQKALEFRFDAPSPADTALRLTARVEAKVISKNAFQFPRRNTFRKISPGSEFYSVRLNRGVTPLKDKFLKDKLLFNEYSITGSGHPNGFISARVSNDGENLYVTLDFTPDNTMDGEKDFAAIYSRAGNTVKEFKVNVADTRWGTPEFAYNNSVSYQHKVYNFSIPLSELSPVDGTVELAFAAYGTAAAIGLDFGDAPDPTYPTLLASNGARHTIRDPADSDGYHYFMGAGVDLEADGFPTAGATGDDTNNTDDEDGVTFTSALVPGTTAGVDVLITEVWSGGGPRYLNAWVDFNQDGDWADAGERIINGAIVIVGINSYIFPVPAGAVPGTTYARFRTNLNTQFPSYDGLEENGEVEDHIVAIGAAASASTYATPALGKWGVLLLAALLGAVSAFVIVRRIGRA